MRGISMPQFPDEPAFRQKLQNTGVTGSAQDLLVHEELASGEQAFRDAGMISRLWQAAHSFVQVAMLEQFPTEPMPGAATTALIRLILTADLCRQGDDRHPAYSQVSGDRHAPDAEDWSAAIAGALAWSWTDRLIRIEPYAMGTVLAVMYKAPAPGPGLQQAWTWQQAPALTPPDGSELLPKSWLKPLAQEGLRAAAGRKQRFELPGVTFTGSAADWSVLVNLILDDAPDGTMPQGTLLSGSARLILLLPPQR